MISGVVMGPAVCQGCGALVYWARSHTRKGWNGPTLPGWLAWRDPTGGVHGCMVREAGKRARRPS
jgi:hypothetical protein